MIREAMQYLHERFVAGQTATPLPWLDEPRAKSYSLGGQVVRVERPATPRRLVAGDLADFCDIFHRFADPGNRGSIWHDDLLVGVFDDRWRDEHVRLVLRPSGLWGNLVAPDGTAELAGSQSVVCARLRSGLAGLVDEAELRKLEKLAATTSGRIEGETGANRDRGVREFQAELAQNLALPPTLTLRLPRWHLVGCPVEFVRASLEVDPRSLSLAIRVLPGELEVVERRSRGWLRTTLCELLAIPEDSREHAPIYWGEPNLVS